MRILIRVDGDAEIGAGHVMRMLALAEQALAAGDDVTFASARIDEALAAGVCDAGIAIARSGCVPGGRDDAIWTSAMAESASADWVVVDGYVFGADYQDRLKAATGRLLVVDDDGGRDRYAGDLILNQNAGATCDLYSRRRPGARLLIGPRYALLRASFASVRADSRVAVKEHEAGRGRILVTLGGADPANATERVVDALECLLRRPAPSTASLEIKVVIGPNNRRASRLAARQTDPRIAMLPAVTDMGGLMRWADLAITGAGVTVYELCCLGVPAMVLSIADRQRPLACTLEREGLSVDLGWHAALDPGRAAAQIAALLEDPARRAEIGGRGRECVDGLGSTRVRQTMAAGLNR